MKAWWAAFLGGGAVIVAVAWPAGAGRIALLLVAVSAAALTVPTLLRAGRRFPLADEAVGLREGAPARVSPAKPNQLLVLERSISASFGPTGGGGGRGGRDSADTITHAIREQLRTCARRRLVDHHRLDPDDPAALAGVHRIVSPTLWAIVAPLPRDPTGRTTRSVPVSSTALVDLVAEIERL